MINDYITSISEDELTCDEIKSLLYILTLTKKGLKSKWIQKIVNISKDKWGIFIKYF